jgi:hypothetical protein
MSVLVERGCSSRSECLELVTDDVDGEKGKQEKHKRDREGKGE